MAQQMFLNSQTLVVGRYYIPLCLSAFFFYDRPLSALNYCMSLTSISTFRIAISCTDQFVSLICSIFLTHELTVSQDFFFFLSCHTCFLYLPCSASSSENELIFTLILEITLHSSLKKYTLGVLMFKIKIILQLVVHFLRWEWGVRVI